MEHKFDQTVIDRYTSDLAEKLLFGHFNMYDEVKGEDLKQFTEDAQINAFLLEDLLGKWKGEMSKLESPYFDFQNDKVQEALKTFMNSLSHHINVGKEDFAPIVETAVKRSFEIVFRPYVFLKENYLNIEEPIIPIKTLKSKLKYIKHNRVLIESVLDKYDNKGQTEIVTDDLIDEIAALYTEKKDKLIDPEEYVQGFSKIQQADLDLMFKKEQVEVPEPTTEEDAQPEAESEVSEEIISEEPEIIEEESSPQLEPVEESVEETEEAQEQEIRFVSPDEQAESNVEAEELTLTENTEVEEEIEATAEESEVIEEFVTESEEPKEVIAESEEVEMEAEAEVDNEPLSLNDQLKEGEDKVSLAESFQQNKVQTVKAAIGLNQRYAFVNGLFEGNQEDYETAINEVDSFGDYEDASNFLINNFAEKYNWDQKEDVVEDLFNLLARKF